MLATKAKYIYPPRATTAIPRDSTNILAKQGWIAQYKVNDQHIMLDYNDQDLTIWDRHNSHPKYDVEPLQQDLNALRTLIHHEGPRNLIDGGLLHKKHSAIRNTLVLWDWLVKDGEHLLDTTYQYRHDLILVLADKSHPYCLHGHKIGLHVTKNIIALESYGPEHWEEMWQVVEDVNKRYDQPLLEGLMLKNPLGQLVRGYREVNNNEWLSRSRVTTGRHSF